MRRDRERRFAAGVLALGLAVGVLGCGPDEPAPAPIAASPTIVTLVAANIAFEGGGVVVPAATAFTLRLDNRDAGVPHGLVIMGGPGQATEVAAGTLIVGPGQTDLGVPTGLVAGAYQVICPVHPATMTVALEVGT